LIMQLLGLSKEMNSRILYLEDLLQESLASSDRDFGRILVRQDSELHDRLTELIEGADLGVVPVDLGLPKEST
jgi:hypothetical protein